MDRVAELKMLVGIVFALLVFTYAVAGVVADLAFAALRRWRLRVERAEAVVSWTHREPSRPCVPGDWTFRTPDAEAERITAAVRSVLAPVTGHSVGIPTAPGSVSRVLAFRRELAEQGKTLDDLRIE